MDYEKVNKRKKAEQWDRENVWKRKKKKLVKKVKKIKQPKQPSPTLCCSNCGFETKVALVLELHNELCIPETKPLMVRKKRKNV